MGREAKRLCTIGTNIFSLLWYFGKKKDQAASKFDLQKPGRYYRNNIFFSLLVNKFN